MSSGQTEVYGFPCRQCKGLVEPNLQRVPGFRPEHRAEGVCLTCVPKHRKKLFCASCHAFSKRDKFVRDHEKLHDGSKRCMPGRIANRARKWTDGETLVICTSEVDTVAHLRVLLARLNQDRDPDDQRTMDSLRRKVEYLTASGKMVGQSSTLTMMMPVPRGFKAVLVPEGRLDGSGLDVSKPPPRSKQMSPQVVTTRGRKYVGVAAKMDDDAEAAEPSSPPPPPVAAPSPPPPPAAAVATAQLVAQGHSSAALDYLRERGGLSTYLSSIMPPAVVEASPRQQEACSLTLSACNTGSVVEHQPAYSYTNNVATSQHRRADHPSSRRRVIMLPQHHAGPHAQGQHYLANHYPQHHHHHPEAMSWQMRRNHQQMQDDGDVSSRAAYANYHRAHAAAIMHSQQQQQQQQQQHERQHHQHHQYQHQESPQRLRQQPVAYGHPERQQASSSPSASAAPPPAPQQPPPRLTSRPPSVGPPGSVVTLPPGPPGSVVTAANWDDNWEHPPQHSQQQQQQQQQQHQQHQHQHQHSQQQQETNNQRKKKRKKKRPLEQEQEQLWQHHVEEQQQYQQLRQHHLEEQQLLVPGHNQHHTEYSLALARAGLRNDPNHQRQLQLQQQHHRHQLLQQHWQHQQESGPAREAPPHFDPTQQQPQQQQQQQGETRAPIDLLAELAAAKPRATAELMDQYRHHPAHDQHREPYQKRPKLEQLDA